jgi:hypothetical protein
MSESPTIVAGDTVLRAADDVLRRNAGDETVLLDLGSEEFYGLDGAGARAFELLERPQSLDDVIDTVHREYDVDRDTLAADLHTLVRELIERNLLVVAG